MSETNSQAHGHAPVGFPFSPDACRDLARRLRAWFRRHRRELPWRRDRDPYAIWVSEVMLQQTQVATVIPYFERFLQRFPTVSDLAAAPEQEVLRHWEGLGYYRRARGLHRAAQILTAEHGGAIPDDPEAFGALPGVGRYTLGAVLSQAFDRRMPILEANTVRVLSRLLGSRDDPRTAAGQRRLWETAEALLPAKGAGDFNQALMELGSLVCTPRSPDCASCPVAAHCRAFRDGTQADIPPPAAAPLVERVEEAAVVVRREGQVLLARRPDKAARWAGMWEFPHGPAAAGESHADAARRVLRELAGVEAELGPELMTIRHGVTRFRITLVCFAARHLDGQFRSEFYVEGVWLSPVELHAYPVSAPQRRLAKALLP